jgi:hypothetical protein
VSCDTNYPFSDQLAYTVESETDFTFFIRVPEWTVTDKATIKIGDGGTKHLSPNKGHLQEVKIKQGTTNVTVTLPMDVKTVQRGDSVAFYRGPLLYAADIAYNETRYHPRDYGTLEPLPEEQVHPDSYDAIFEPVSEWRFAVDPLTVTVHEGDEMAELPNPLFVRDGPPTSLEVEAYPIDWPVTNGTAASPPSKPVVDAAQKTTIRLIPYGAAKVHIAEFPVASLGG